MQLNSLIYSMLFVLISPLVVAEQTRPFTFANTLVTKFSGTVLAIEKKVLDPSNHFINETFINPVGASVRISNISAPGAVWQGQLLGIQERQYWQVPALAIGQVFSATYDSQGNAYVAASSSYGLNITIPDICEINRFDKQGRSLCLTVDSLDKDKFPERVIKGHPSARWMVGQFGQSGSPGSVWKIDGRSGKASLFADIRLAGLANSGAALGDVTYDSSHNQFFVSDLDTGMIHRVSNNAKQAGTLVDYFDHGETARAALGLQPVRHDNSDRIDITDQKFNSLEPNTWGFAKQGRQVWALQYYADRLYYSVWNGTLLGSEIWSVGIDINGKFLADSRLDIQVPEYQRHFKVTDIAFNKQGAMVLAQRGDIEPSYDYQIAVNGSNPRVLRYWQELPNDPATSSAWIAQPEEYAVGNEGEYRSNSGGIAFGYGYTSSGQIDTQGCKDTLWVTGHNLLSVDKKQISGLQGSPAGPVRDFNTPPTSSYFIDEYPEQATAVINGWLGDVEVYTRACQCQTLCSIAPVVLDPPILANPQPKAPLTTDQGVVNPPPSAEFPVPVSLPEFPVWCPYGLCGVVVACIPPLNFWPWCDGEEEEVVEPEKIACMLVEMSPAGPFLNGNVWSLPLGVTPLGGNVIDSMRIFSDTASVTITSGVTYAVGSPTPTFLATDNQTAIFDLCGFDSTAAQSGEPYDCCRMKVKFKIRESQSPSDHQQLEIVQ